MERFVDQLLVELLEPAEDAVDYLLAVEPPVWITVDLARQRIDGFTLILQWPERQSSRWFPFGERSALRSRIEDQPLELWSGYGLSIIARCLFDRYLDHAQRRGLERCEHASLRIDGQLVGDLP